MKKCPYCAEQIQDEAIKCRYCGASLLPPGSDPVSLQQGFLLEKSTSGMAIASLILGILWLYWIGSVLALVFGYIAKRDIKKNPNRVDGKGLATAGIVLGWIGVSTLVIAILVGVGVVIWGTNHKERPRSITLSAECSVASCLLEPEPLRGIGDLARGFRRKPWSKATGRRAGG